MTTINYMKKQQQLSLLHPSINIPRGREKKDLIDSMNVIRLLPRFEAALQEVLYHPVVPLVKQKSSSSSTITTANGSISGGQHSSNSTFTANTSITSTSTTVDDNY